MFVRWFYINNGNPYTGKTKYLSWDLEIRCFVNHKMLPKGILFFILALSIYGWKLLSNERWFYMCNAFFHRPRPCSAIDRKGALVRKIQLSITSDIKCLRCRPWLPISIPQNCQHCSRGSGTWCHRGVSGDSRGQLSLSVENGSFGVI